MLSARPADQHLPLPASRGQRRGDEQNFFLLGQHLGFFQWRQVAISQTAKQTWETTVLPLSKALQRGPRRNLPDISVSEFPRTWLRDQREWSRRLTGDSPRRSGASGRHSDIRNAYLIMVMMTLTGPGTSSPRGW